MRDLYAAPDIPWSPAYHGMDDILDDVVQDANGLVVVEYKVNNAGQVHLNQTNAGEQMSIKWIDAKIKSMNTVTSSQYNPQMAAALQAAKEQGTLQRRVVVTNPLNGSVTIYAPNVKTGSGWSAIDTIFLNR